MNTDNLAQELLETYGDSILSSELVVYIRNGDQIIRETITIDFWENDYQYQTNVKPIYTE
jgi:hypothetical protein